MPIFGFFGRNFSALAKRGSWLEAVAHRLENGLPQTKLFAIMCHFLSIVFIYRVNFCLLAMDYVDVFCNGDTHIKSPKHHEESKIKPCAFTD